MLITKIQRTLKNKKGFTLVELIVVLVILAILAAILVPAMSGYIDKANKQSASADGRTVLLALQTIYAEQYQDPGLGYFDGRATGGSGTLTLSSVGQAEFSLLTGASYGAEGGFSLEDGEVEIKNNAVSRFVLLKDGSEHVIYDSGQYSVPD